jgi:hypothetical protein
MTQGTDLKPIDVIMEPSREALGPSWAFLYVRNRSFFLFLIITIPLHN